MRSTTDFRLEDVWALPTPGGPDEFPLLVQAFAAGDPAQGASGVSRLLWAIRWKVGGLLGWDDPDTGLGSRVPTLRDRLPDDLRDSPAGPEFGDLPFSPLYLTDDEFAAEIANKTVHGVMHLSWVADEARTATTPRWPSTSNPTACSATPTWPRSSPSGTFSSTRR